MQYRKKAVIEAFKYDGDLMGSNGEYYVPEWAVRAFEGGKLFYKHMGGENKQPSELFIRSGRGLYHVAVGDYIIMGDNGELYPCNSSIFEDFYEQADKSEPVGDEFKEDGSEDKQKILDLLLPALRATHNLSDLASLTYINEAGHEGVMAEFINGGKKYANTEMDSGTAMIKDILSQII